MFYCNPAHPSHPRFSLHDVCSVIVKNNNKDTQPEETRYADCTGWLRTLSAQKFAVNQSHNAKAMAKESIPNSAQQLPERPRFTHKCFCWQRYPNDHFLDLYLNKAINALSKIFIAQDSP